MKNIDEEEEEEGGWKLAEAFAVDTKSTTTWPPKSYTCSFCRREFRSAQALGGHMNVHRRDRAQFHHQAQVQARDQTRVHRQYSNSNVLGSTSYVVDDPFINWTNNVGFGLFYQFDDDNYNYNHNYGNNVVNDEVMQVSSSEVIGDKNNEVSEPIDEEIDLELRLGYMCTKFR